MFQDSIECYQAIGSALNAVAPSGWTNIKVQVHLDGVQVDAVVSCTLASKQDLVYLTGVPRLASYFHELARLLSNEEKGLFKSCDYTLESNGKFNADFTY